MTLLFPFGDKDRVINLISGVFIRFGAKFSYGDKLPEPDTIAAWKGPLRTVSLKLLYSNGETLGLSFTIPADWEFDVYEYCPWGTAYLDEGCTELYEYPGDGIDYTIYVCEGAE